MAFAAHGLHGLQGSVASAMHSATVFFAAQGLHGLHPARATLVPPIATSDIVTASAIGLRLDRFEAFLVIKELLIIQIPIKLINGSYTFTQIGRRPGCCLAFDFHVATGHRRPIQICWGV